MNPAAACRLRPVRIAGYEVVIALGQAREGVGLNESDTRPAMGS